jgi:hypothetical protein
LAERGGARSLTVKVNAGIIYICARQPERALECLIETVELEPQVSKCKAAGPPPFCYRTGSAAAWLSIRSA